MFCVSSRQSYGSGLRATPVFDGEILQPGFVCSARLLPEKLTVYTTLVGLLNARNYNFGGEFVEAMIRQLKETLKNNLYDEAVHLVSWWFPGASNEARVGVVMLSLCRRCVFCLTWSTVM